MWAWNCHRQARTHDLPRNQGAFLPEPVCSVPGLPSGLCPQLLLSTALVPSKECFTQTFLEGQGFVKQRLIKASKL